MHRALTAAFLTIIAAMGCAVSAAPKTSAAAAADTAPATPAFGRSLVVVGNGSYPPYLFRDEDGLPTGLVADEWALWSKKTGVHVDLQPANWLQAQQRIAAGQADVIDTILRTPERERTLAFTETYLDIPARIYTQSDIGGITDLRSLHGFRVGALEGSVCDKRLRESGITTVETYTSHQAVVDAALGDGPKAFCMDGPAAEYFLYRANAAARFHQAFTLFHGEMHRAVRRDDAQTLALVEKGFAAITPEERQALEEKWLGSPLPGFAWQRAARVVALTLALAVVVAVLWGLALRRAVNDKTEQIDRERRRLLTLINTLPDLVWLKGVDGAFLGCNRRFEQFIGAAEEALLGRTERDFLAPELAAALADVDRRAMASGHALTHQFTLTYAADGHQEQVESVHTPVIGPRGEAAGVLSIARDVTQSRDTEQHLRRLNRLYQVLTRVHAAIAQARTPEALYDAVCRTMVDDGGLRMAWIGCPDYRSGELVPVASAGLSGTYLHPPHASLAAGPLGMAPSVCAFREGRAMHCTDIARDPAMATWRDGALALGFFSSSAYPLRIHGRTAGVFTMYSGEVEFFDDGELALLERLSSDIGRALESYELDAEREHAVIALRDSETRFESIFRMSPAGLGIARFEDKRYLDVNDSFLEMFGLTRAQALNRNGLELDTWVDGDVRAAAMETLGRDGEVRNIETRFRTSGGDVFHASFAATRVSIGREELVIASYFDLTAQRLAARTLEERKLELERIVSQRTAELSSILDAMPDLYVRMQGDGTIVDYRSGRNSELFGNPADYLGRNVRDALPPEAAQPLLQAIAQALGQSDIVVIEYPIPSEDGTQYFEARLRAIAADHVISFVRNITDRRSLEADRERARLRAVELASAKSEFLANMSHEIRTPLNGLLGLAQLGLREADATHVHKTFAAILDSGRLLLGIVNDVLDFSKTEVGKLRVEQRPLSPAALARGAVALLRGRAQEKRIALELVLDPALPEEGLGDALRLQQVLVNLLSNAVKFTEAGGVSVWVGVVAGADAAADLDADTNAQAGAEGHAKQAVGQLPARGQLVLRVSDTGIGIPADQLSQLFVPFHQADTSTTRRFGGTGLGLAISERLAQLMGGTIRVQSRPGEGSTFELRVPWLALASTPSAPAIARGWGDVPKRLNGVRVLVAEDNEVNQMVLERALTIEGAQVTLVGDGRQAVNRVLADGREAFDIVLMDIQMPEMDGYEATRRILELAPDLPVIGQTAHAMQDERRECLAAGMVDHIAKPIDFRRLVDTMVEHIDSED